MKYSHQREVILQTIRRLATHLSAADIYQEVKKELPSISLGTVYRNLNSLADHGMIRKIENPFGSDQFDFTLTPHSHLYCQRCHHVYDINTTSIEEIRHVIEREHHYQITSCNMVLEGICHNCQPK